MGTMEISLPMTNDSFWWRAEICWDFYGYRAVGEEPVVRGCPALHHGEHQRTHSCSFMRLENLCDVSSVGFDYSGQLVWVSIAKEYIFIDQHYAWKDKLTDGQRDRIRILDYLINVSVCLRDATRDKKRLSVLHLISFLMQATYSYGWIVPM